MNLKFRRPSTGTTIAMLALFVALTSTAYAASLPKNSVGNKQLKKNAVTSAKIKTSGVLSSDVKNDSLTGSDINESTLATVPSATSAQTAQTAQTAQSVNGSQVSKINYRGEAEAPLADIFSGGGLTLRASCIANTPALVATSSTDNAMIHTSITTFNTVTAANEGYAVAYDEDDDFDVSNVFDLMAPGNTQVGDVTDSTQGTLTYTNSAGNVVTVTYLVEDDTNALGGTGDCHIIGTASVS